MASLSEPSSIGATLRTPRAAAVSGIIFSILLILVLTLITVSQPSRLTTEGAWITDADKRRSLSIALALVPFAGIAFLWFIGVIRDRLGDREDKFFSTVFLGSGLLFLALLFVASAIGAALVADVGRHTSASQTSPTVGQGRQIVGILVHDYALRMAGVFTMSTATILHRTRVAPRWIARLGFVAALVLLFALGLSPWLELVFPAWIGLLSVAILWLSLQPASSLDSAPTPDPTT